jgi:hypothetical protein
MGDQLHYAIVFWIEHTYNRRSMISHNRCSIEPAADPSAPLNWRSP